MWFLSSSIYVNGIRIYLDIRIVFVFAFIVTLWSAYIKVVTVKKGGKGCTSTQQTNSQKEEKREESFLKELTGEGKVR